MTGLPHETAARAAADHATPARVRYRDVPPERLRRDEGFYRSARDPMPGSHGLWASFLARMLPPATTGVAGA